MHIICFAELWYVIRNVKKSSHVKQRILLFHDTPTFSFIALLKWVTGLPPLTEWDLPLLWDMYLFLCVVVIGTFATLLDSKLPEGLAQWLDQEGIPFVICGLKEWNVIFHLVQVKRTSAITLHENTWTFFEDSSKYKSGFFFFQWDWKYAGNKQSKKDF